MTVAPIMYLVSPVVDNDALDTLFDVSWPDHRPTDFRPMLSHSLAYICAFAGDALIGFVNLAWDGGSHVFLLDTTVHPGWRRRGVGRELVRRAAVVAQQRGMDWLHVDYEPHLESFYRECGFMPTQAGLINLGAFKIS